MAGKSYLISFVKGLLERDNTVIKEENKKQLEAKYFENGISLNKNLADKYEQVSEILAVYKYISARVKSNRASVGIIKNNLTQCKQLLQCNRDDLRRLWLELVEKRNCVKLLDCLEDVRLAPELVTALTEAKRWTDATLTVLTSKDKLNDGLQNVVGVATVKTDLSYREKTLINRMKCELHKLIFTDVMNFALINLNSFGERRNSDRNIIKNMDLLINEDSEIDPQKIILNPPYSNLSLSNWRHVKVENEFWSEKPDNFDIKAISKYLVTEDKSKSEECQQAQNIISVIFSLHQFNKLQEMLNEWSTSQRQTQNQSSDETGLMNEDHIRFLRKEIYKLIFIKSIEHIKRSAMSQSYSRLDNLADCRYLLELLDLLYVTLFQCQSALLLMHRVISYLINSRKINIKHSRYEELHIYFDESAIRKMIQLELKSLLSVHLKISDKDRLLNGTTEKYENEFIIPSSDVLKHHMGKKKGLLSSVSVIQSNLPAGSHSSVYHSSDHFGSNSKAPLFKFSHSSHALSVSACIQEMKPLTINTDSVDKATNDHNNNDFHYPLVCKPHHNNITAIYGSVMEFIENLEAEEHFQQPITTTKKPCILREYIHKFIENVFLEETLKEMNIQLNSTLKDQDPIKGLQNLVSQASERELGLQRPIIAVMLTADQCLEEIKRITLAINHYSIQWLKNGFKIMNEFTQNLWIWFKKLPALDTNFEAHMSTEWGKDEDLIRFWKEFPSWQKMTNIDLRENYQSNDHSDLSIALRSSVSTNDGFLSPGIDFSNKQFKILSGVITNDSSNDALLEEREARHHVNKESDHVLQLIKEELKSQKSEFATFPVFQKNDLIKLMARLHESVAWFVLRTARFQSWIQNKSWLQLNDGKKIILTDQQQNELNKVIKDFSNLHNKLNHLADACLMSIHLEGRLRAYNFISRLPFDANYGALLDEVDVDHQVSDLVKSLNDLEFALTHSLTRHKFRFVFEGLGNFVSALLVQILFKIRNMSTSGVKKMCRNIYLIQQTLSVLTQTHEMDLVRVKQLYELLHITPETVVNKIMEEGSVYNEEVYKAIFSVYQRSNPLYDNDKLNLVLMRLHEVINMAYV